MTHADRLRETAIFWQHCAESAKVNEGVDPRPDLLDRADACLSGARAIERLQEIEKEQKEQGKNMLDGLPLPTDTETREVGQVAGESTEKELLAALKTLTQDSRFSLAIGGNPNAVDALVKQVDLAIAKAEGR